MAETNTGICEVSGWRNKRGLRLQASEYEPSRPAAQHDMTGRVTRPVGVR